MRIRTWKKIVSMVIVFAMTISVCAAIGFKNNVIVNNGDDVVQGSAAVLNGNQISQPAAIGEVGTTTNPYVVLEIVPYAGYAEFGYLVGGQEPTDLDTFFSLPSYTTNEQTYLNKLVDDGYFTEKQVLQDSQRIDFSSNVLPIETSSLYTIGGTVQTATQYGKYVRVAPGTGNYEISAHFNYVVNNAGNGNFYKAPIGSYVSPYAYDYVSPADKSKFVNSGLSAEDFVEFEIITNPSYIGQRYSLSLGSGITLGKQNSYKVQNVGGQAVYSFAYPLHYTSNKYQQEQYYAGSGMTQPFFYPDSAGIYREKKQINYYTSNYWGNKTNHTLNSSRIPISNIKAGDEYNYMSMNFYDKVAGDYYIPVNGTGNYDEVLDHVDIINGGGDGYDWNWVGISSIGDAIPAVPSYSKYQYDTSSELYAVREMPLYLVSSSSGTTYYENTEMFKREVIGLKSSDGHPDTESYEFEEWYYDQQGTLPFDPSKKVYENTTVYAKWGNYTVTFDDNVSSEVVSVPGSINRVLSGTTIPFPEKLPFRKDYVFTGWYTDPACDASQEFKFDGADTTTKVYSDMTLYAGWDSDFPKDPVTQTIRFNFDVSAPNPGDVVTFTDPSYNRILVNGLNLDTNAAYTEPIPSLAGYNFLGWFDTNGKKAVFGRQVDVLIDTDLNGFFVDLTAQWEPVYTPQPIALAYDYCCPDSTLLQGVNPVDVAYETYTSTVFDAGSLVLGHIPTRSDKVFAGWYLDAGYTTEMVFGETVVTADYDPDADSIITLFARWVEPTTVTVTFDCNCPADALATPSIYVPFAPVNSNVRTLNTGEAVGAAYVPSVKLDGNIRHKIDNFHIRVITVTPQQLNLDLSVIGRANMISISSKLHLDTIYGTMWNSYRNTGLFNEGSYSVKNYNNNDLSWDAAYKIFEQAALADVPVLFDYDAYKSITGKSTIQMNRKYYGNNDVFISGSGSDNNIYKLYLMLNQMDPVLFYNAYVKPGYVHTENEGGVNRGAFLLPSSATTDTDVYTKWGETTFLPYVGLEAGEYVPGSGVNENTWRKLGVSSQLSSHSDPIIHNNCFSYQGNWMEDFMTAASGFSLSYDDYFTKDIYVYYDREEALPSSENISPMQILKYLYNYSEDAVDAFTNDLSILELQPSYHFMSELYWFWYCSRAIENFTGSVTVSQQSTAEFIGKIDDLNSMYNLIYIGLYKDQLESYNQVKVKSYSFETVGSKKNISLSESTDYYAYTHIGKKSTNTSSLQGSFGIVFGGTEDNINDSHFSGNDITQDRYDELLLYAKAGYPIIFAKGFYNLSGGTLGNVNTDQVDPVSNMYLLARTLLTDSTYGSALFYEPLMTPAEITNSLKKTLCKLVVTKQPVEYIGLEAASELTAEDIANIYVNGKPGEREKRELQYIFRIEGDDTVNTSYRANLYLDTNADGIYNEGSEGQSGFELHKIVNGVPSVTVSWDSSLEKNVDYLLKLNVPDDVLCCYWKLEVVDTANTLVRDMTTGMAAFLPKLNGAGSIDRPTIKVLQIASRGQYQEWTVFLPTLSETENLTNAASGLSLTRVNGSNTEFSNVANSALSGLNRSAEQDEVTAMFWFYTKDLNDYNIITERITVDQFDANIQSDANWLFTKGYDMVILGFADCYGGIDSEAEAKALMNFINAGKAILFTHDTTSFFNEQAGNSKEWGYIFNKRFRDVVGMDRYGVTLLYPYLDTITPMSIEEVIELGRDVAWKSGTFRTLSDEYLLPGKDHTIINTDVYANIANNQSSYNANRYGVYLEQGYTNTFQNKYQNGNTGNAETNYASVVNHGQITKYPYTLGETLRVSTTHTQYYQLDLEADDIVVWYTLGKVGVDDSFGTSPHDARNSYYIYNRGNITYTGVGHTGDLTDDEVKLFVNTIVAAYKSAVKEPGAQVRNRDRLTVNGTEYLYLDFDTSGTEDFAIGEDIVKKTVGAQTKQYKRVFYNVVDPGIASKQTRTAKYYRKADATTPGAVSLFVNNGPDSIHGNADDVYVYGVEVTENGFPLNTYKEEGGLEVVVTGSLNKASTYYFDIPLVKTVDALGVETLSTKQEYFIYIDIAYNASDPLMASHVYGIQNVTLLRRGLYDID